jgi:alpha-tubulin suppressor-like RCC1 family protein
MRAVGVGRESRRAVVRRVLSGVAAAAVVAGGLVAVSAPGATAAPGPNPYTDVRVTKKYDGTGHGTDAASFVNTANGFSPGDDGPSDGVVSSGDVVGYEVELKFQAGPKRTVAVSMGSAAYLRWSEGKAEFCAPVPGVSVQVSGNSCLFTIEEGAAASVTRTLLMTASDAQGLARTEQKFPVSVGISGQSPYASVETEAVTVVSAPQADLTIRPSAQLYAYEGAASGGFTITPRALKREGFSPVKGVSTGMQWEARVNVSAFPEGTTWRLGTQAVTPVDGWLTLKYSGERQLNFTVPGGWPEQDEGSTAVYDVWMEVPGSAFRSTDYLNNGDGWQPGTGKPQSWSTYDPKTGSIGGTPYPNNDYSAARVYRPIPASGELFSKRVAYPYTGSQSKFEPGNMQWAAASSTGYSNAGSPWQLAAGAQFRQELSVLTTAIEVGPGDPAPQIVVADEWDPGLQRVDGFVNVTGPDGTPVDPASYRIFWSTTETGDPIADASVTQGWVEQEEAPAGGRAIRVVFAEGALPVHDQAGAGAFTVTVPAKIRESVKPGDGPVVQDVMRARVGDGDIAGVTGAVQVVFPVIPTLQVEHTVANPQTPPGSTASYRVRARVVNPPIPAAGFAARVEVEADRCVTDPVSTNPAWQLTVIPAEPGPSGRVCGDPESTPARLVFTPAEGLIAGSYQDWNKTATLPDITYDAKATYTARDTIVSAATFSLDGAEQVLPASAEARSTVPEQLTAAARVSVVTPQQEIEEPLTWRVDLAATLNGTGHTETVIALPRNGDGAAYQSQVPNWTASPKTSSFQGSLALTGAGFGVEDTTDGAEVFFTVTANPTLNPGDPNSVWHPVSQAGQGGVPPLAGATALKVRQPANGAGENAALNVTLQPTGNRQGNNYLLWAGRTITDTGVEAAPVPWPARAQVVMASASGTVWNDVNNDAVMHATEPKVQGASVGLYRVVNGVIEDAPVRTAVTNATGYYSFTGLVHGDYVTRVDQRGPNLPAHLTSYYGQDLAVDPTFSFINRRFANAAEQSTVFTLAMGGAQNGVNYGFHAAEPKVDIDKNEASLACNDTTGVCDVAWQLTLTNLGNTPVAGGTLTDTAGAEFYDVETIYGEIGDPVREVVSHGSGAFFAVTDAGRVYSWGAGGDLLGNGTADESNPVAKPVVGLEGLRISELVLSQNAVYAITDSGQVYAWGGNLDGELGNGGSEPSATAAPVLGLEQVVVEKIAVRPWGAYALTSAGQVYSWGRGINGENGNGGFTNNLSAQPVQGLTGVTIVELDAGSWTGYGVTSTGRVLAWGNGNFGRAGNGTQQDNLSAKPVLGLEGVTVQKLVGHPDGGFAITSTGALYVWGSQQYTGSGYKLSAQVVPGLEGIAIESVWASGSFYALTANGGVYAWGNGAHGALGNGTTENSAVALPVLGLESVEVKELFPSYGGAFALTEDGSLFAWGTGLNHRNGNGSTANNLIAAPVQRLENVAVRSVIQRFRVFAAVTSSGELYAWGNAPSLSFSSAVATALGGFSGVKQAAEPGSAYYENEDDELVEGHAIAGVAQDGSVLAWGSERLVGNDGTGDNLVAETVRGLPELFLLNDGVLASSAQRIDGFIERQYPISTIPVGESLSIVVRGKVNQGAADANLLNQAWFTSPSTPYAGIAKNAGAGRAKPILPADPAATPNPAGIPGNPSCDTDVDGQNSTTPDSCDQVPVRIPLAKNTPGGVRGTVWADANHDGRMGAPAAEPRVAGVAVALYNSSGAKVGEAVTDADGAYAFTNIAPGTGYTVEFAVLGTHPSQPTLDTVLGSGLDPAGYTYGVTARAPSCMVDASCASPTTSRSHPVPVLAGAVTEYVNAGLTLDTAKLVIDKTSDLGDPAVLPPRANGTSDPLTVKMRFTNTGDEPLGGLRLVDTTATGRTMTSLACVNPNDGTALRAADNPVRTSTLAEFVLAVGQSVDCTGTLPSMNPADSYGPAHRNVIAVTGKGVETGQFVEAGDPFEAAIGTPQWTMAKTATTAGGDPLHDGTVVRPGDDISYVLTVTNTGLVSLDHLVVTDDASQVLNSARLSGALPAGLSRAGAILTWQVPAVAPGQSVSAVYTVTVKNDAYDVTILNLAHGDGIVPPQQCAKASPCRTQHGTPPWFAFGLPVLGGDAAWMYGLWGGLIVAAAAAATVTRRRRRSAVP